MSEPPTLDRAELIRREMRVVSPSADFSGREPLELTRRNSRNSSILLVPFGPPGELPVLSSQI